MFFQVFRLYAVAMFAVPGYLLAIEEEAAALAVLKWSLIGLPFLFVAFMAWSVYDTRRRQARQIERMLIRLELHSRLNDRR